MESGFFQYEDVVVPDHVRVLAGSKFEGNPFSGVQYQPQLRAVWTLNRAHSLWGSFSRAIRDPSHAENDLDTIGGVTPSPTGPIINRVVGDQHLQSEHLKAYELGYRLQPSPVFSIDVSTYYNSYDHLIVSGNSQIVTLPGKTVISQVFENATAAHIRRDSADAWRRTQRELAAYPAMDGFAHRH